MRLRLPLLGLVVLLSSSLEAQQLADSVTVEVVDVPVFVSRNGDAVEGLTREDFELYVNGKRHPIDYFDVVSAQEAKPDEDLRQRRLFLLLFDLAYTDVHDLGRARRAALELIRNAPAGDLFAIGSYSARRGVWFASPFTRDRVALARAIGTLASTRSGDPLSLVMTTAEAVHASSMQAPHAADRFTDEFPGGIAALVNEAARDIERTVTQRPAEDQLLDLGDLGRRLASLQGQKHVVLMSNGFDGRNRRNHVQLSSLSTNYTIYERGASSALDGGGFGISLFEAMRKMARAFHASDVFLHTLDVEGVSDLHANGALFAMAHRTGGKFIHNENNLDRALANLSSALGHGYVLGFTPRNARADMNTIEVRVRDRRGADVHHRRGFSGTPSKTNVDEGLYLADVVMNDVPQTGTAAALSVNGATIAATLPMTQLAAQVGKDRRAELLVYFFDANGAAVDFRRLMIEVPPGTTGDRTIALAIPTGARVAKALLRVNGSLGFTRTTL